MGKNTLIDIDGNKYKTVNIGQQLWTASNMKVTHYRNGDEILKVKDNVSFKCEELSTGALCAYNNDERNVENYGYLYNWYTVVDSRKIAPEGWHVPTEADWRKLEMHLGMSIKLLDQIYDRATTNEGDKLKSTEGWHEDGNGTNESGFSALPGGGRISENKFADLGIRATFWSATEYDEDTTNAWFRMLLSKSMAVVRGAIIKHVGFSLRVVRD